MQIPKLPMFPTYFMNTWTEIYLKKHGKKYPWNLHHPSNLPNLRKAAEDLQGNGNAGHGAGSPSLPASTESRTPATSRSPRSPNDRRRDSNNDQELPGIKPVPRSRFAAGLWWFFFIFYVYPDPWGNDPFWRIFFKWVASDLQLVSEVVNQHHTFGTHP